MSKAPAKFLLIDVSNSFTKLAFSSADRVGSVTRIATAQLGGGFLRRMLQRKDARALVISSVVPKKNAALQSAADGRPVTWLSARSCLNVSIEYPKPSTIGADRLANVVAVTELYGVPAIVIDFGTAVTFDVVSGNRAYLGGVIAPGLEAMSGFLHQRTALLPRISFCEPRRAMGKSTREAMLAGAVFGYRGLVREILRQIVQEQFPRQRVRVVATGGYGNLIARALPEISCVHKNLTLEGLRLVGNAEGEAD